MDNYKESWIDNMKKNGLFDRVNTQISKNKTPCPNCGNSAPCFYRSVTKIEASSGSICSTLHNVCKKCADAHDSHAKLLEEQKNTPTDIVE